LSERPEKHYPPVPRDFALCEPSWQRAAACAVSAALEACAAAGPAQRLSLHASCSARATHMAVQSALRAKAAAWLETDGRFGAEVRSAIAAEVLPWPQTVDPLPADTMLTSKHVMVDVHGHRVERRSERIRQAAWPSPATTPCEIPG